MKKLLVFTALAWGIITSHAQQTQNLKSKVTDATVYFQGAELTHSVTAPVVRGANEILVEGLSPSVDASTLRVKATGGVIVSSTEFSLDYTPEGKYVAPSIQKLQAELEKLQAESNQLRTELSITSEMLSYLKSGVQKNISGSENGMGIDDLVKTMEYYNSKANELYSRYSSLENRQEKVDEEIQRLQSQLNQEQQKSTKMSGVLKLNLVSPASANSIITITYFTNAASWQPFYDINIASADRPVNLVMRAKVNQITGFDWDNVKLSLSSAMPSNSKVAPLFSAWFLQERKYELAQNADIAQNSYLYNDMELEEAVVVGYGSAKSSVSSGKPSTPLYVVDGIPMTEQEYKEMNIDPFYVKTYDYIDSGSASALYGSSAASGVVVVTLKVASDFVTSSENDLNEIYNLDTQYTIPGNGKVQTIDLRWEELKATYNYYCAPKLDGQTYLLAQVQGWEKLGLMNAHANVTYDETFIGETMINASSTQKELSLTLGTDPRVVVKREKLQDYTTPKNMGSSVQQTFAYKLTVRNNRNQPIQMVVKEQYPISMRKDIEVTINKETTPWTANKEDIGVVTWEEPFEAGETKTYTISYTVKYPKGMQLNF